jgi:GNAT superfamily N-acetyltransferase
LELNCRELNVLRRLLNRAEVRPLDVAQLGVTRLESAQGLGKKGLEHVLAWLDAEGYSLRTPESVDARESGRQDRIKRRLEQAQLLLEQWGWQVRRPDHDTINRD